ncbi:MULTISPECIES: DUF3073 domain-containing protein [Corynebacterium]|uniref:DUF3073 domain-containing protein n=1 Tax=Corynebacterium auriscanis TaxID=99807 RepID=A0A0A2DHD0_9CORY|nr:MULTISPECIES: DUF3073 domain-containing protein [Corynebacterium]KGM18568.1 hypothetical protein MA47_06245 [Corynebacterium auriscanis]MCX2163556.1 DUF3073 domain-containing protein [Corynebacterium auriscanis]OFT87832.1 hypothetical protein HMPREF3098_09410 [Corynebacterium sp. HMSC28B08]WJY72146.1 hypothetical protein CAURIC_02355 [Corynebacterium auriscanis]
MGRGRAKAKQAKVARQLKYNTPEMDLERLQRELSGSSSNDDDRYSSYDDDEWDEWNDEDNHSSSR